MKFLVLCEGSNEEVMFNLLLEANKLKIKKDDLIGLRCYNVRQLSNPTIMSLLRMYNREVTVLRIGDTQKDKLKIPNELKHIISCGRIKKYCTLPEFEILLIINEGLYNEYLKTKNIKPKEFAKANINYNRRKYDQSDEFIELYYGGKRLSILISNLKEYKRLKKHKKDDLYLADLLR